MLSNSCMKSAVGRFNALETGAIEAVRDEKLREKALALKKKEGGFTLLELLVVVAILAIVAGTMLGALGGQEKRASSGAGANSIAAVESLLKGYQASGTLLNDLDALESMAYGTVADATPDLGLIAAPVKLLGSNVIGTKLAKNETGDGDKIKTVDLAQAGVDALKAAGITKVRLLDAGAADNSSTTAPSTGTINIQTFPTGNISEIDIPGRLFDNPIGGKNRGRGFSAKLPLTGGAALPVWKRGITGIDNLKLGAGKIDVLVALGFGNNVIVGASSTPQMNSAPAYGGVLGNQYNRYITLWNVGTGGADGDGYPDGTVTAALAAAKLQAVVDTRGDFLDEELAEASGQKQ